MMVMSSCVDLVRDIGPQLHAKSDMDGIVVDPVEEIFSSKLTTLVSRQEIRDLVDVLELERRGLRAENFLAEASAKDGAAHLQRSPFSSASGTSPTTSSFHPVTRRASCRRSKPRSRNASSAWRIRTEL
jgi:hypothetical protein